MGIDHIALMNEVRRLNAQLRVLTEELGHDVAPIEVHNILQCPHCYKAFQEIEKEQTFVNAKLSNGVIRTDHGNVRLTPTEHVIMKYMFRHQAYFVPADGLISYVWSHTPQAEFMGTNTLAVHMSKIRRKIKTVKLDFITARPQQYKLVSI